MKRFDRIITYNLCDLQKYSGNPRLNLNYVQDGDPNIWIRIKEGKSQWHLSMHRLTSHFCNMPLHIYVKRVMTSGHIH